MNADYRRAAMVISYLGRSDGRAPPNKETQAQAALRTAAELTGRRELSDQARQLLAPRLGPRPNWDEIESNARKLLGALPLAGPEGGEPAHLDALDQMSLRFVEALIRQEEALQDLEALRAEDAPLHFALEGIERERVDAFLVAGCAVGWAFIVLDKGLSSWERFSASIGTGGWMREEFENALDGRDRLHRFRELIISDVRRPLDERLNAADALYLKATDECERLGYAKRKLDGGWQWWWWRTPKAGFE